MRRNLLGKMAALTATVVFGVGGIVVAQDPPGPGGPPGFGGRGGPGGPLVRAVENLQLPAEKRDAALVAVRAHQDSVNRLTDLASAGLLLKLKEVLSTDEFRALQDQTDKSRRGPGGVRTLTANDVVERILSFDKSKAGKITADELPERMQSLVEKGDTNKDGALDREEIKKLAADSAKDGPSISASPVGRGGRGGRGGQSSPGSGLTSVVIEQAVDDLKLPVQKKETANAVIKSQQLETRTLTTMVRAELLLQLGEILNEDELKTFKAVLDRQPGVGDRPGGRNGPPPGRGGPPPFLP
jgi:hypothetical protein